MAGSNLSGQELAQHLHHQTMIFFLRQAGYRHGADHSDIAHDDRKRTAMRSFLQVNAGVS